jgi:hypothetical protein
LAEGQKGTATATKILALPRLRKTHLALTLIEFAHALILMLWVGSITGFAAVVVPTLMTSLPSRELAVGATLAILEQTAFLGCGAGAFLLLTTLLMHLFSLRAARATVFQVSLLLVMTTSAVASQVLIAPKITAIIRGLDTPLAALPTGAPVRTGLFHLLTLSMSAIAVQIAAGIGLLLFVVRRWYCYIPARARSRARGFIDPSSL